ncbi:MAG: 2-hydroxyacyl-CoA dehydratase [Deltaproteobacteria bacterium]|nr:2-hydroxyacyl-CoA dehydratase [Deltaproteobacteria bacterium]
MWTKLFSMCGFDQDEIDRERPRIEKALERLGINEEDVKRGEQRVRDAFEIELEGVRKLLRIHMTGCINLMLARDENSKVIYVEWPLPVQIIDSASLVAEDVYIGAPAGIINMVLGQIFGKNEPVIEAGEATGMPPGGAHCALFQTELGAIVKGLVPVPDLMIGSNFFCEPPAATVSLLKELYDIPVIYVDGCTDSEWGLWPQLDPRVMKYLGQQLDKCMEEIGRFIGKEITEEVKRQGFKNRVKYALQGQFLFRLIAKDPQPLSQADASLAFWLLNTPLPDNDEAVDAITSLLREVEDRVEQGVGVVEKGAPRIHFTLNCAVDTSIVKAIEQKGVSVAVLFWNIFPEIVNYRISAATGGEKMASALLKAGGFSSTSGAVEQYKAYVKEFDLDGVIICYSYSCRAYTIMPHIVKDGLRELGVPSIILEGDFYDNRIYSAQQMRTRIEAFVETLKVRKAVESTAVVN